MSTFKGPEVVVENLNAEQLYNKLSNLNNLKEIMPPETITVFFASNTTQLAYDHPDHSSSMFTYYLLKGLKGAADNGDKMVTVSELHNYVLKNVEDSTKTLYKDLPQIPILFTSNPDRVLYKLP